MQSNREYGRRYAPDVRDAKFRLSVTKKSKRRSRRWSDGGRSLDQLETFTCVGHAIAHYLLSDPIRQSLNPFGIYEIARTIDEWEGEDYEGTSVRAGMKVLEKLGFIAQYSWAKTKEELNYTLLEVGPVVVGTNWYTGMAVPDKKGFVSVTGDLLGGHAYLLNGINLNTGIYEGKNSYGVAWGLKGKFFIPISHFDRLLKQDGEVCLAVEKKPED